MNQNNKSLFIQFRIILAIALICSWSQLISQTDYALLHHHLWDDLLYTEHMPDGSIRFFAYSNQTNDAWDRQGVHGRARQADDFFNAPLSTLTVDTSFFNYRAFEFFFQSLSSGSVIVAANQFSCDYSFPGGICLVDAQDSIRWIIDLDRMGLPVYGSKMVFVDENRILVDGFDKDLVIDTNGVIIANSFQGASYDKTIQTETGFIASRENNFYILSASFDLVDEFHLPDEIYEIAPKHGKRYLIRTENRSFEWQEGGDVKSLPASMTQAKFIWWDDEHYWASFAHHVVRFDNAFQQVETLILPVGVEVKDALLHDSTQLVLTQYDHPISQGILLYEGNKENLDFTLPYDIGITKMTIPDTVPVGYLGWPYDVYVYEYAFVDVEVTNFGLDTIHRFEINSMHYNECDWCSAAIKTWEITDPLAPGETRSISLGPYNPRCLNNGDEPLCLATLAPNLTADGNVLNDTLCRTINHIILAAKDPGESFTVELFPNPVDDKIHIRLPGTISLPVQMSLMDLRGVEILQEKVYEAEFEITTSDLMPGSYLLRMENMEGTSVQKLIIQH